MAIPKKVADRMAKSVKRFQPVLESAKTRDGNESYAVKATVLEQKPRVTYTVNVPYTEMKTRLPEQCVS